MEELKVKHEELQIEHAKVHAEKNALDQMFMGSIREGVVLRANVFLMEAHIKKLQDDLEKVRSELEQHLVKHAAHHQEDGA